MRSRVILALALLAAALAAGCGEENSRALLAEADSQALLESVDRIESACADEDVSAARAAADDAAAQINELPRRVDDSLQSNLRAWIDHIQGRIDRDCKAAEEETPTPTETPSPTETPTPTETPAPTETPTETPVPTETPAPTETPTDEGSGGVPAPEEEGG